MEIKILSEIKMLSGSWNWKAVEHSAGTDCEVFKVLNWNYELGIVVPGYCAAVQLSVLQLQGAKSGHCQQKLTKK